jgi:hypothetical protein
MANEPFCPNCGTQQLKRDARFCHHCGAPMPARAPVAAAAERTAPPVAPSSGGAAGNRPWLWLIPLVLAALAVGSLLLWEPARNQLRSLVTDESPSAAPMPVAQVISEASATPAPTAMPTATPVPTETVAPTLTFTPSATPTNTPTPTPLPPGSVRAVYQGQGNLNLRMGPGMNYPVLDRVEPGAEFAVLGRDDGGAWLQVQAPAGERWAAAEVVTADHPPEALAVVATPAPPAEWLIAESAGDFSATQGARNWLYGASKGPGSLEYDAMPFDGKWYRWANAAGRSKEMRMSAEGAFPSRQSDVMRIWNSPYRGEVLIEGKYHKEAGAGRGGDGVNLRIVWRRQNAEGGDEFANQVWSQFLGPYDTGAQSYRIGPLAVEPGDQLYFVTSAAGGDDKDNTVFQGRLTLLNAGGVVMTPTPAPPTATPRPAPPALCFKPVLRHFEEHKGCCGEVVGLVKRTDGSPYGSGVIRIEGPPVDNRYVREFGVAKDGGYEITALSAFGAGVFYDVWLRGNGIRSDAYHVEFKDAARIRAVVDFFQVPCNQLTNPRR